VDKKDWNANMKLQGNTSSHHFRDAVYVGAAVMAVELSVSVRRVRQLCEEGRIEGAILVNGGWLAPLPLVKGEPCTSTVTSTTGYTTSA
jgi:hypothetical protein